MNNATGLVEKTFGNNINHNLNNNYINKINSDINFGINTNINTPNNSAEHSGNTIMDKRYIEVDMSNISLDYEKEMLTGLIIPSLLPMNILKMDDRIIMCFNTSGYKTLSEINITSIEFMFQVIKNFIKSIHVSEQYLLRGPKHFYHKDMVFWDMEKKEVKLIYGRQCEDDCGFADNQVILNFLFQFKNGMMDSVLIQIVDEITDILISRNPRPERLVPLIEEIERNWYRRHQY